MSRSVLYFTFVGLVGLLSVYWIADTFRARLSLGDNLAPYSTYRADPIGARALYESLRALPGLQVERNERSLDMIMPDRDAALVILGAMDTPDNADLLDRLDNFVAEGGHVLIAFTPNPLYRMIRDAFEEFNDEDQIEEDSAAGERRTMRRWRRILNEDSPPLVTPKNERFRPRNRDSVESYDFFYLSTWWGFQSEWASLPQGDNPDIPRFSVTRAIESDLLPESVPWYSPEYLQDAGGNWRTLYARDEGAVIIERNYGKGTAIVATDSYLFSNEALRKDRHAALLMRLLGGKTHIIFEETTKGVAREPGIVALMKRYHLHLLVVGLVVLGVLYIWQTAVPLLPRWVEEEEEAAASLQVARESKSALAALLRQHVPKREVLATCWAAWEQGQGTRRMLPEETLSQAESLLCARMDKSESDRINRYGEVCALLHKGERQ